MSMVNPLKPNRSVERQRRSFSIAALLIVLALGGLLAFAAAARTQPPLATPTSASAFSATLTHVQTLTASGDSAASAAARFGASVALNQVGDTALVGAYGEDDGTGAAYVYMRDDSAWAEAARLMADDARRDSNFGYSVALDAGGTIALIGSPSDDISPYDDQGSAYVFVREGEGWVQAAKLVADDGGAKDGFGWTVALSGDGDTALIGALDPTANSSQGSGAAYVFVREGDSWRQQAKLSVADPDIANLFGISVALDRSGDTALIADPIAASVYPFTRQGETWTRGIALTTDEVTTGDVFGWSVALDSAGMTALVSAALTRTDEAGARIEQQALIFVQDGVSWVQQGILMPEDAVGRSPFGLIVALSDDGTAALLADPFTRTAVVFSRAGESWTQRIVLTSPGTTPEDAFGWSAALATGERPVILVGAVGGTGAMYIFEPSP